MSSVFKYNNPVLFLSIHCCSLLCFDEGFTHYIITHYRK